MKSLAFCLFVAAAAAGLAACGGTAASTPTASLPLGNSSSGSSPITHIVVMVQENRTMNNLFATFPGITGTTVGKEKIGTGKNAKVQPINLKEVNIEDHTSLNHLYVSYKIAYDHGKMDAFNQIRFQFDNKPEGWQPYQYVNPQQIQPYWTMAKDYGIANAMFQTQGSGSFTAHQDLIRGGTELTSTESLVDDPDSAEAWGCDSPSGTLTSLLTTTLQYKKLLGPFPCTSAFPGSGSSYETLANLLDAKSVSWKYYVPKFADKNPGALWNAFDVISAVRYGSEWGTNVSWPETNIFNDISGGSLSAVSWVIPDASNSDHPGYGQDTGPSWVASVVNAVGNSSYWGSTAVIVLWDDWGGFYDPVAPPKKNKALKEQGGPGFRVPLILISPYTRFNASGGSPYISETFYNFGSVVRFIEDTFNLGQLGTTDSSSNSLVDMLDFNQQPRKFQSISSSYSRTFFLHQKPSGLPVDTE